MNLKSISVVSTIIAALFVFTGHARAEVTTIYQAILVEPSQATKEVSTEQLRRILVDGSAMVIDSRPPAEFVAGHIPGARVLDVPQDQQVNAITRLVKDNKAAAIVLYCNGPYCQASRRLANRLVRAGFTNVRRYQLGMPVWRALGGPTQIELEGISRIYNVDRTAVFLDARTRAEFRNGSLPGAQNAPADEIVAGKMKKLPLPLDDFNRRVTLFGRDGSDALKLANYLSKRPWHNVSYYAGRFDVLAAKLKGR